MKTFTLKLKHYQIINDEKKAIVYEVIHFVTLLL